MILLISINMAKKAARTTAATKKKTAAPTDPHLRTVDLPTFQKMKKYKFEGGFTKMNAMHKLFIFPGSFFELPSEDKVDTSAEECWCAACYKLVTSLVALLCSQLSHKPCTTAVLHHPY